MKKPVWAVAAAAAIPVAGAAVAGVAAAGKRGVLNCGTAGEADFGVLSSTLRRLALQARAAGHDPETGCTDYAAAIRSPAFEGLQRAAAALRRFDPGSLESRAEKLAFWINLYNTLTLHALLVFRPRRTVWEVPGFFERAAYDVGGFRFSLNDIEHGVLRANRPGPYSWRRQFGPGDRRRRFALTDAEFDSRIHFALNCGSRSCPPVSAYDAAGIEAQLELASRSFIQGETDLETCRVVTSAVLKWYRRDLGEPREVLMRYLAPETAARAASLSIAFKKYDWSLA